MGSWSGVQRTAIGYASYADELSIPCRPLTKGGKRLGPLLFAVPADAEG